MKLRYQLRGLGIGIIVTALLMGVALGDENPISDAEIRARALELGMVDGDSMKLTDIQNKTPPSSDGSGSPVVPTPGTESPVGTTSPEPPDLSSAPDSLPVQPSAQNPRDDFVEQEASSQTPEPEADISNSGAVVTPGEGTEGDIPVSDQNGETAEIVIEPGENSSDISRKLAEAGLVEDGAAFDKYLCDNGYSRRIRDGVYRIPVGTSEEKIAEILVKGR